MIDLRAGTRVKVLAALVAVMFAALTTRLWFLQVLAAELRLAGLLHEVASESPCPGAQALTTWSLRP